MKKFVLLVLCFFVLTLKTIAASGPDLAIYRPGNWTSPLICSMKQGATTPDYTLKKGVTVYARFAIKNVGDVTAPVGDYIIKVGGEVVVSGYAPVNLQPGDTLVLATHTFTYNSTGLHTVTCMVDYDENLNELNEGNNTFSATYRWVTPGPDLAIYKPNGWSAPLICSLEEGATTPDYALKKGVPVYVRFGIKNVGNEVAPVGDYVIKVGGEVVVSGYAPVNLQPGGTVIPSHTFTYNSAGLDTVKCIIDYDGNLNELNESNNDFSDTYEWVESGPDLAICTPPGCTSPLICSMNPDATAPDYILKVGVPVYVKFGITNVGNEVTPVGDYVVMVDEEGVVEAYAPVNLGPGDTIIPFHQFTYDSTGPHTVTVKVDYDESVDELDEDNNDFSDTYEWLAEPEGEVDLYDEGGIVNISFPPYSFDDPDGDVDDPLGCVYVDNLFLAGFSPEQIEEGHFSYIDNPEMNQYIRDILNDLGTCSLYVFVEGDLSGKKFSYSKAAKFNITGDDYQRIGSAQVWQALEDSIYERFADLREARQIIIDNNWNFTADLTLPLMGFSVFPNSFPIPEERVCEPSSFMEALEFNEEELGETYSVVDLPPSFDWRDVGGVNWMTPVKNQTYVFRDDTAGIFRGRYYGACYIMGPFGAAEAFYNIHMANDPDFDLDLSEQHCICKYGKENPMPGGITDLVFEHLGCEGFVTEDCLPYSADKAILDPTDCDLCDNWESKLIKIPCCKIFSGSGSLEEKRNTIKEHLMETPLAFGVGYENDETFKLTYAAYTEGIFPLFYEGYSHVMVLVGWGDTIISGEEVPYWIVKNSSGPDWGDNGYIKMKMADNVDDCIKNLYEIYVQPPEVGMFAANPNTGSEWYSVDLPFVLPDFEHSWLQKFYRFLDPIVVMGPPSYEDTDPTTVRVKDVTYEGFKFQLDEWDYQDGTHGAEIIPYLVVEKGAHIFGGMKFEARKIEDVNVGWRTVELKDGFFSEPPVILTQVVTRNGEEAVVTRIRNVSTSSFEIMLQEEEANDGTHAGEAVHYIAISPGSTQINGKDFVVSKTSNSVTDNWCTINFGQSLNSPVVLASINTGNDDDPCALRYKNPNSSSIEVKVEEEQSEDSEVQHVSEVVGYIAISDVGLGTDRPVTPSSLDAVEVTPTAITLVWEGDVGSKWYEIERKEGPSSFSRIGNVSVTSYRDNGLVPGGAYTYRVRAYNYGGYSDYSEEFSVNTLYPYDFDKISVNPTDGSEWQQVSLPASGGLAWKYQNPIVVMGPPSNNETDPTTIRVKDVNYAGFQFQIDEWDYLDGVHGTETISYMVMEEGVHNIDGGIWEASSISGVDHNWKTVNFESGDFDETPVVLAQVVTINETSAVVTRIRNITANSFEIKLQEEEASNGTHAGETVHYIATEAKSGELDGRKFLVHKRASCLSYSWWRTWYRERWTDLIGTIDSPVFIAEMQSCEESDPCALRYRDLGNSGVYVKVEEENSAHHGVWHWSSEDLGYLVISVIEPELSTFKTAEAKIIYENYIKLVSPIVTGNIVLNVSSNYERKAQVELIDIAGRVVGKEELNLKRGRENLSLGQFKSGVYFLRIKSDEMNKHEVHKITVLR
jgi:plastocyanin